MKNVSFLSLLFFLFVPFCPALVAEQKMFTTKLKNKVVVNIIKLEFKDKDTFARGKEVFMRSFHEAYKEFTPEQLYLENKHGYLQNFLDAAFEDEENDFNSNKKDSMFVVAKDIQSHKVIGFAGYDNAENSDNNIIYIRQLAIDPAYKKQGLGAVLCLDTIKMIAQNKPTFVTVCTRKINEPSISFYQKLNFQDASMDDVHPELPASKYRGFTLNLNEKKR